MEPDGQGDNGERQPDPDLPDGGTEGHRRDGARIEHHNRPIAVPTEAASTRPEPDPDGG